MGATTLVLEHIVRYIRSIPGPALTAEPGAVELAHDATTGTLKFASGATTKEVADLSTTQTITGAKTFTGAATFTGAMTGQRRSSVVTDAAEITVTAAQSGTAFLCTAASGTQIFTLPLAATGGLFYTFVCRHASGEIHVGVGTGDNITGKSHGAENGTALTSTTSTGLLKNTAATNVLGDFTTLQSDGVTGWHMTGVAGVWSVT